jgi:CRISPR-associated endonuclease/helicase Cas3
MVEYRSWFSRITGFAQGPHDWQAELALADVCTNRLIRILTGLGKTEGVFGAWLWHSVDQQRSDWPRRLAWCLPMRVLVEQTANRTQALIDRWAESAQRAQRPKVHVLMGGEESQPWHLEPTSPAVLVGTQDMLLSRALNRGYASGRARWPMEYALLNQDCLWVMDEVQLMDVGLATSVQLQAFRDEDQSKRLRPCYTWWMSATLQPDWLDTVDFHAQLDELTAQAIRIPAAARTGALWQIRKPLRTVTIPAKDKDSARRDQWANVILGAHQQGAGQQTGHVTLVIVNRVEQAQEVHAALQKQLADTGDDGPQLELIHSRFRGLERRAWADRFLSRETCENPATNLIIVSTQVVEAGVDISATALVTELAPWPSLVQRFGRAARYGGTANITVVDPQPDEKTAPPYELADLNAAREAVSRLDDVAREPARPSQAALSLRICPPADAARVRRVVRHQPRSVRRGLGHQPVYPQWRRARCACLLGGDGRGRRRTTATASGLAATSRRALSGSRLPGTEVVVRKEKAEGWVQRLGMELLGRAVGAAAAVDVLSRPSAPGGRRVGRL